MDRRGFLRAIVAIPVAATLAQAAFLALPQPFKVARFIDFRLNLHAWQVYYTTPFGADEYYHAELIHGDPDVPIAVAALAKIDERAWLVFNNTQKRLAAGLIIPPDHDEA